MARTLELGPVIPCTLVTVKSFRNAVSHARNSASHCTHTPLLSSTSDMVVTPEERRWAIVHEWNRSDRNTAATARQLHLSLKAVRHWTAVYEATGGVRPMAKSGRKPVLSGAAAARAHALLLDPTQRSSKMVAQQLQQEGITAALLDKTTVIRAAKRVALNLGRPIVARRGHPRKQLTEANKQRRVDFCTSSSGVDWSAVMVTDRKRFLFHHPRAVVKRVRWLEKGQRWQAPKCNHPQGVNVYGGLTVHGVTSLHEVTGTSTLSTSYTTKAGKKSKGITQDEYKAVLTKTLLRDGATLFGKHKVNSWMLQQDNDGAHRDVKGTIRSWSMQAGCTVELVQSWPGNSPDLSPIENLWSYIDQQVQAKGCKSFAAFRAAVHAEWSKVSPEMARQYMSSMHTRLAKCIAGKGEMTNY